MELGVITGVVGGVVQSVIRREKEALSVINGELHICERFPALDPPDFLI